MRELIDLHGQYEDAERYKLAGALTQDIFACEHLSIAAHRGGPEQVSDRLGFYRQAFRHLSPVTKERDYALDHLNNVVQQCCRALEGFGCSDWSFTGTDAAALLDYCQRQGVGRDGLSVQWPDSRGLRGLPPKVPTGCCSTPI